jgi:organic radical activating enzyme
MELKVREIFHTLQGEGARAGESSIFIRLSKCNLNCWFCDTDWSFGINRTLESILEEISKFPCKWIVWTGGEPTIQLTEEVVTFFKTHGYKQAIETNGTNPVPNGIDYISCSPKDEVSLMDLQQNFPNGVNEWRYVLDVGQEGRIPLIETIPPAQHYFISPMFSGEKKKRMELNPRVLKYCINFVLRNPGWKLSVQQHKWWGIL